MLCYVTILVSLLSRKKQEKSIEKRMKQKKKLKEKKKDKRKIKKRSSMLWYPRPDIFIFIFYKKNLGQP